MKKWKLLKTDSIYESKWMSLFSDTFELPNGRVASEYLRVHRDSYVVIFAINKNNEVLIERQYRRGVDLINIELPAGNLDAGEKPEEAAIRELKEETGYNCVPLRSFEIFPQPAFVTFRAHIVICELKDQEEKGEGDQDEFIEHSLMKLSDLEQNVLDGKIQDNSLITALGLYKLMSGNKQ